MVNEGLHFSSSISSGNMDKFFDSIGDQLFSEKERWEINKPAAKVYETALKYNLNKRSRPLRETPRSVKDDKTNEYVPRDRDSLVKAIDINKDHGGAVSVGFTRKSEKSYIGRFLNDGWDPRNQHGGPYSHVPGEHFFEKSAESTADEVKEVEAESLRKVLKRKGL